MFVWHRKGAASGGLAQLARAFWQIHDETPSARRTVLRAIPLGSLLDFLGKQMIWHTQRAFLGITLVEIRRHLDLAHREVADIRDDLTALASQVEALQRRTVRPSPEREPSPSTGRH